MAHLDGIISGRTRAAERSSELKLVDRGPIGGLALVVVDVEFVVASIRVAALSAAGMSLVRITLDVVVTPVDDAEVAAEGLTRRDMVVDEPASAEDATDIPSTGQADFWCNNQGSMQVLWK